MARLSTTDGGEDSSGVESLADDERRQHDEEIVQLRAEYEEALAEQQRRAQEEAEQMRADQDELVEMLRAMRAEIDDLKRARKEATETLDEEAPTVAAAATVSAQRSVGQPRAVFGVDSATRNVERSPPGGAPSARRWRAEIESVRRPEDLTRANAQKPDYLEDWLFRWERALKQYGIDVRTDHADAMAAIDVSLNQEMTLWWEGMREAKDRHGAQRYAVTWEGFGQAAREQFGLPDQINEACRQFWALKQEAGEQLREFFFRVDKPWARASKQIDEGAAIDYLMNQGIRAQDWPFSMTLARRAVRSKEVRTVADLRALLVEAQMEEPNKPVRAPQAPKPMQQQQQQKPRFSRAAAIEVAEALKDKIGAQTDMEVIVNAVQGALAKNGQKKSDGRGAPKCFNCGRTGHKIRECTFPTTCRGCGKEGHKEADCTPEPKEGARPKA